MATSQKSGRLELHRMVALPSVLIRSDWRSREIEFSTNIVFPVRHEDERNQLGGLCPSCSHPSAVSENSGAKIFTSNLLPRSDPIVHVTLLQAQLLIQGAKRRVQGESGAVEAGHLETTPLCQPWIGAVATWVQQPRMCEIVRQRPRCGSWTLMMRRSL